mmetsp:Transcript_6709/g.20312  ORF Transcript_6709/g.20312 Transcript_6709/m.20312 type:complete len:248 (+) Transcript_6709:327-1070(+)
MTQDIPPARIRKETPAHSCREMQPPSQVQEHSLPQRAWGARCTVSAAVVLLRSRSATVWASSARCRSCPMLDMRLATLCFDAATLRNPSARCKSTSSHTLELTLLNAECSCNAFRARRAVPEWFRSSRPPPCLALAPPTVPMAAAAAPAAVPATRSHWPFDARAATLWADGSMAVALVRRPLREPPAAAWTCCTCWAGATSLTTSACLTTLSALSLLALASSSAADGRAPSHGSVMIAARSSAECAG